MGRILALDYGRKRTGIAVTDPLQIIANSLTTVATNELESFLVNYMAIEVVDQIVIGLPVHADGNPSYLLTDIQKLKKYLNLAFPDIEVFYQDESFTSVRAKEIMLKMGMKKKKRRDKSQVDKISAVLILQEFLGHI